MNSSIVTKTMLATAIMLVAAFAGIAVFDGEDVEAANAGVSLDGEFDLAGVKWTNTSLGNDLAIVDGKVTGTVAKADAAKIQALWGAGATEEHVIIMTFTIQPGQYLVWEASDNSGIKTAKAESDGQVILGMRMSDSVKDFVYAVSTTNVTDESVYNALIKEKVTFDVELLGDAVDIYYTVGDLTYIKRSIAKQTYTLVSMDDLRAVAPEGYEFAGWAWDGKVLDAGAILTLAEDWPAEFYTFTATFKEIPVQEVFKVEFIVDGIVIQTCQSDKVIVPANPAKEGFKFTAWTVDGVMANPANYFYTEDVKFTAAFEAYTYKVTFVAGGEVVGTPQTVKHGDLILAPALPAGFESWNFDFTQGITEDTIIVAVEAPEPEPTGADDPMTLTVYILVAFIIIGLIACFVYLLREGKIVIGLGKKKEIEAPAQEEPKQ